MTTLTIEQKKLFLEYLEENYDEWTVAWDIRLELKQEIRDEEVLSGNA